MKQLSKSDLKNEFFENKKLLAKEKTKISKLMKNTDKEKSCPTDVSRVCEIIKAQEKITERQREIAKALVLMGEDKRDYMDQDLFDHVKNGDCAAIAFDLLDGADIDVRDKDMWTPLHIAALNGYGNMVEFFLRMGAGIENKNHMGRMPLHVAVSHNHVNVVEIFLKRGSNPFLCTKDKKLPIHFATSKEMIELLGKYEQQFIKKNIDSPAKLNECCDSILFYAVSRNYRSVLPELVKLQECGNDMGMSSRDEKGNTILHLAVMNDDEKSLELLFSCKPYPFRKNANGKYPIELSRSAKVKNKMMEYEEKYVCWLTSSPEYVRQLGNEFLLYCAEKGYADAVGELLKYTKDKLVDIDICDTDDNTPLHLAVKYQREDVVAVLLRCGAELLVINKKGLMPVDYIRGNKKLERIFNNYERIWVNRILSKVGQKV
jgi:ankyrin repeat protein